MELKFTELNVRERDGDALVVNDGTFSIIAGQISCVLALEALPKKIFLSVLSGQWPLYQGTVLLNGTAITHAQIRDYVDLIDPRERFLPTLTVRESLTYAALLRQSVSHTWKETRKNITEIEELTGLTDIADGLMQSTSQLTKTRLHIACELLQRKQFYVLIDPFEDLEFKESLDIMLMLRTVCTARGVGLVLSTSSASGHGIERCDVLACLYQGKLIHNDRPELLRDMLCKTGLHLSPVQNPVEQLLSLLSTDSIDHRVTIQSLTNTSHKQNSSACFNKHSRSGRREFLSCDNNHVVRETALIGDNINYPSDVKNTYEDTSLLNEQDHVRRDTRKDKTPLWFQIFRLTERNFISARRRILFPISILQNSYILLICVLVWWRPERNETTVKDRTGLIFFTTVQWAFFALLDAVSSFPKEMSVILKEQRRHLYNTSSFCVAKTLSELPLAILQPCVYLTVIYWVANLRDGVSFIKSVGILIADVIAAQSIGLLIGTALKPPKTFIVMSLGLLSMMLWGGAFCTPPWWLQWGKFASFFTYGVNAFVNVEFRDGHPIECSSSSMVPVCSMINPGTNATFTHFPSNLVLDSLGITWSAWENVIVLLGVTIVTRLLWYICLKLEMRNQGRMYN